MRRHSRFISYARSVHNAVERASLKPLLQCGARVERAAKTSMRAGGGVQRTPSAPGTPPHVQTGVLRSSIATAEASILEVVIGPTEHAWYGRIHEHGGRHHPKRPFMRPALRKAQREFPREFKGLKLRATR